ncbi:hypothetical protein [Shewanella maritima]|uniref:hypothetical protein n=1 Tax=Shewanella maritima TaxID=2520507 RepID=UPI003735EBBF
MIKKSHLLLLLASCLLSHSALATETEATLETKDAIGIGGLMICDVFFSDHEMPIQGAIVKKAVMDHQAAGVEDMIMTQDTSDELERYLSKFRASDKENKMHLCNQAIEYARNSSFTH